MLGRAAIYGAVVSSVVVCAGLACVFNIVDASSHDGSVVVGRKCVVHVALTWVFRGWRVV